MLANRFVFVEAEKPRIGGMSTVKKAVDRQTGRMVAVKFVVAASDDLTHRIFTREANSLRALSHPNIIELIASGLDETDTYYHVLPWYEKSLSDILETQGALDWADAFASYAAPLASALSYAHLKQVEHRDVKPANILIDEERNPLLADFGIGKLNSTEQTEMTVQGFRSGIYAPPELNATLQYVRDVYSFGVLTIQMLHAAKLREIHEIEEALQSIDVPPDVRKLLEGCISSDPYMRPRNGSVLAERLRDLAFPKARPAADRSQIWITLTNSARRQITEFFGDSTTADASVIKDLAHEPFAEFRFDAELARHDQAVIMVTGESCRYT